MDDSQTISSGNESYDSRSGSKFNLKQLLN